MAGLSESQLSQIDEPIIKMRKNNTSNSPKYSPRKGRSKRTASASSATNYSNNSYEDKHSTESKLHQQLSFTFGAGSEQINARNQNVETNNATPHDSPKRNVESKRALPSSLAESLRAVFAAFLWHEGIVHDAMACASFLKFHPSLPKDTALLSSENLVANDTVLLSREQRAQQRYSVEVANAGNYLNIRPSTLETLTKSGNSSVLNRRYRKNVTEVSNGTSDQPKLEALPEMVTICPPALRCLVYLWEQLCSNCVQVVQSNSNDGDKDNPSQTEAEKTCQNDPTNAPDSESKKNNRKKKDDGTWCELCEIYLPIPVTYHMRIVHPGCKKPAKSKGYNSVGVFCEGWAGNCGEGGKGASSWYLMCDTCRDKYKTRNMNVNNINTSNLKFPSHQKFDSLFGIKSNLIVNSEVYTMMKENSMFLLELSSTGPSSIMGNQKRSPQQMPVLSETQLQQIASDLNKPGTSRGGLSNDINSATNRNSKIGSTYNNGKGAFFSSGPSRRSEMPACISPELLWQAPETFSCLESLGVPTSQDAPYTIFDMNSMEPGFERPLSEISIDSTTDRPCGMTGSMTANPANSLSRFHRSLSMGQGWPSQGIGSKYTPISNNLGCENMQAGQSSKVVLRRRNNSTCDGKIH